MDMQRETDLLVKLARSNSPETDRQLLMELGLSDYEAQRIINESRIELGISEHDCCICPQCGKFIDPEWHDHADESRDDE